MTKTNRLGTALTAVSAIAILAACAGPDFSRPKSASAFGKGDTAKIGLAMRAQVALASNDFANAISLAEQSVEQSPKDATYRALLGNCYLAAGRFGSAEAAYRDSLSLVANQPQVILKLALVQIAAGKNDEAKLLLAEAQAVLDPADVGLALALAGDPQSAVAVLENVARQVGADSRTRQNLALAYAFAGDWTQARVVAGQDVPADQLDARIQQWMALAKPARNSDQVAVFIGVQPVAGDPGQPIRLALNPNEAVRQAAAEPIVQPEPAPQPVEIAAAVPAPAPAPEPVMDVNGDPAVGSSVTVTLAAAPAPIAARPALSPAAARLSAAPARTVKASGKSRTVVQIGAFSSRDRVSSAWAKVAGKHGSLKRYTPVTARFAGAHGTVYRLSVKGFTSSNEAIGLCASLKRAGGSCFVRTVSGDAPIQFASRS